MPSANNIYFSEQSNCEQNEKNSKILKQKQSTQFAYSHSSTKNQSTSKQVTLGTYYDFKLKVKYTQENFEYSDEKKDSAIEKSKLGSATRIQTANQGNIETNEPLLSDDDQKRP